MRVAHLQNLHSASIMLNNQHELCLKAGRAEFPYHQVMARTIDITAETLGLNCHWIAKDESGDLLFYARASESFSLLSITDKAYVESLAAVRNLPGKSILCPINITMLYMELVHSAPTHAASRTWYERHYSPDQHERNNRFENGNPLRCSAGESILNLFRRLGRMVGTSRGFCFSITGMQEKACKTPGVQDTRRLMHRVIFGMAV